jgi:hypothetical protein
MLATMLVIWVLGIVPAFVMLTEDSRPRRWDYVWIVVVSVFWPVVFYLAMLWLALVAAWKWAHRPRSV